MTIIHIDLQRRVQRLLRGDRRVDDLDRIFLALRSRSHGRASISEIGDFVAHRDQRDKGPVTQKVRDIFVSCHLWLRIQLGHKPSIDEVRKVSAANLRTATDNRLTARLNLRRNVAKSVLKQALRKLERGSALRERERIVVNYLGGAFIWNPAFTDLQIASDFEYILDKSGLLSDTSEIEFGPIMQFTTLYLLTLMHGSRAILEDGGQVDLLAGYDNDQGRLEVKAQISFGDFPKQILAPVCVF